MVHGKRQRVLPQQNYWRAPRRFRFFLHQNSDFGEKVDLERKLRCTNRRNALGMRTRAPQLFCLCLATSTHHRSSHGLSLPNRTRITTTVSSALSSLQRVSALFTSTDSTSTMDHGSHSDADKSWRSLLEVSIARTRKNRGSNYVQLSTVENGEPRCRTVVFRGFQKLPSDHILLNECDSLSATMKMCTDSRSKKVDQTKEQPIAEMVWWFPTTSEQYRIRGNLLLVGEDDDKALTIVRKELWGNLSDPARESFLSAVVPGEAYEQEDASQIPAGGRDENAKPVPVPRNFLLMLLDPTKVDYLRLKGDQYRQMDSRETNGAWTFQRVNP